MHILSEHKCFDGLQLRVRHPSAANHCEMTYSLYLPPQALAGGRVPLLYWLSGLTCTDENFTQKAGAQRYAAVSAFAPIVNPGDTPWGQKAFTAYLGDDKHAWRDWDSTALLATARAQHLPIRIDAGDADEFRPREIRCETFVDAARQAGYRVDYHLHPGYDHSYYTIASYIGAHIAFHAEALGLGKP